MRIWLTASLIFFMTVLSLAQDENPEMIAQILFEKGENLYEEEYYEEAFSCYEKAASFNHAKSLYMLGVMYDNGDYVIEDNSMALKYYSKSAELGEVDAMINLGFLYDEGEGVAEDNEKAMALYLKAAALGEVFAMYNIGLMYEEGDGVEKDEKQAFQWFFKAAEKEDEDAILKIAQRYDRGLGVEENNSEALYWYLKVDESSHGEIAFSVGVLYDGTPGVTTDLKKAFEWYSKAAELEDTKGIVAVGDCYFEGKGVYQDFTQAMEWYETALYDEDEEEELEVIAKYFWALYLSEAADDLDQRRIEFLQESDKASELSILAILNAWKGKKQEALLWIPYGEEQNILRVKLLLEGSSPSLVEEIILQNDLQTHEKVLKWYHEQTRQDQDVLFFKILHACETGLAEKILDQDLEILSKSSDSEYLNLVSQAQSLKDISVDGKFEVQEKQAKLDLVDFIEEKAFEEEESEYLEEEEFIEEEIGEEPELPLENIIAESFFGAINDALRSLLGKEKLYEDEDMDEELYEDEDMDEELYEDENMDEDLYEDGDMDEELYEDEDMDEELYEDEDW